MVSVKEYKAQPTETDMDLVNVVRQMFLNHGMENAMVIGFDCDQHIIDARNKRPEVQRHLLNRYFNLQLMHAGVDSAAQRYCLIPDGEIEQWLSFFSQSVLPFCVQHGIPSKPAIRAL